MTPTSKEVAVKFGCTSRIPVELHCPAGEVIRIKIAEDEIGIGRGRYRPTFTIANRPRIGARTLRPYMQRPGRLVQPSQTSPKNSP